MCAVRRNGDPLATLAEIESLFKKKATSTGELAFTPFPSSLFLHSETRNRRMPLKQQLTSVLQRGKHEKDLRNFFFLLPTDVVLAILSEWLDDLRYIARLLSATCSRACRPTLLHCLNVNQGQRVTFLGTGFDSASQQCCAWLTRHAIAIRQLVVSSDSKGFLPLDQFQRVEDLRVEDNDDDRLSAALIAN